MTSFPSSWSRLRVVLAHDWLTGMRGGERVLELLCQGFPDAPIYTLLRNRAAISDTINRHPVRTSWLQRVPGITENYRRLLPLFPAAIRSLRAPAADLLLSTSHCVAKGLPCPPGARHLCYCFTPMRYAWALHGDYFAGSPVRGLLARPLLAALRRWDRRTAGNVHRFVAISRHVEARIRAFYGREADVVYPPVAVERWTPGPADGARDFDLIVSALVPYKRIDLAVRAYTRTAFPLKIVGVGSERNRLAAGAGPNVTFLGWQPDERILEHYRNCRLLVFPGEEDFGIVPLEAQACGKPVVAFRRGGVLETVREGVSGEFFDAQTEAALLDAVARAAARPWDRAAIRANAVRFDTANFVNGLAASIEACLEPAGR